MRIELRGLVVALMAMFVALGLTFGLAQFVTTWNSNLAANAPPVSAPPPAPAPGIAQADIASGHQFYLQSCAACHGKSAEGAYGPDLRHLADTDDQIAKTIQAGVKGKMPSFGKQYSDSQVRDIVGYLRSAK